MFAVLAVLGALWVVLVFKDLNLDCSRLRFS